MGAKINNKDATQQIIAQAGIVGADPVPNEIADKVLMILDATPRIHRYCKVSKSTISSTTGAFTIYTTPSDKDFYLTSCSLSLMKDATCDTATGAISLFSTDDAAGNLGLIAIAVITLTAQTNTISLSFPTPVKIGRARALQVSGTFTVGAMSRAATIQGYFTDIGVGTAAFAAS